MAGGALLPDYYKQKMLVTIFLAPPSTLKYNPNPLMHFAAIKSNRLLIESTLDLIHMWNILPYNFMNTAIGTTFC